MQGVCPVELTLRGNSELEAATYALHSMCLQMVDEIVRDESDSLM